MGGVQMSFPTSELEVCHTQDGRTRAYAALTGSDLLVMGSKQAAGLMSAATPHTSPHAPCVHVCAGDLTPGLLLSARASYTESFLQLSNLLSKVALPSDVPRQQLLTCTPASRRYHKAPGFPHSWGGAGAALSLGASPWFLAAYVPPF